MKIKLKTHKGITLISLVVTIIVLLILTGVVLTTLTGENGILSMAKNAREKTIEATEKEEEDLKKAQSLLEGAGGTRVPSSKYGYSVWNTISQINSSLACDRLDASAGYENVRARLIDGYAWDSTIYYIKDSVKSITDSRSYGNYTNGIAKESGVLGKYNLYRKAKEGGEESWICFGIKYRNIPSTININLSSTIEEGTSEMDIVDTILAEADTSLKQGVTTYSSVKDNYQYRIGYELTTGGAESTKIKNIYDLAGNMFEWTAEYGEHKDYLTGNKDSNEKYFAVVRGGRFMNDGNTYSVCFRQGGYTVTDADISFGFRTMLYVK